MKRKFYKPLQKATELMFSAIENYNKFNFEHRMETFSILAIAAYEGILKYYYLKINNLKEKDLYIPYYKGKRKIYKKSRTGGFKTCSLTEIIQKLRNTKNLDLAIDNNINLLLGFRDPATHFRIRKNHLIESRFLDLANACVKNFKYFIEKEFGIIPSQFNLHRLNFIFYNSDISKEVIVADKETKKILILCNNLRSNSQESRSPYSIFLEAEVKFIRSNDNNACLVRLSKNSDAIPIQYKEEDFSIIYPMSFQQLKEKCNKIYIDFKCTRKFYEILKSLQDDSSYIYVRQLNPNNPRSGGKQKFYSNRVFNVLDQYFQRRK